MRLNLAIGRWRRHKNFLREWRRLTKGRNERKLQSQLDDTLASASSENWHDRESVGCKKIMGNDHLREFRVTHSLRAFYKSCENNLHVLVGIQEHPKRGDYNRLYTRDHCDDYTYFDGKKGGFLKKQNKNNKRN